MLIAPAVGFGSILDTKKNCSRAKSLRLGELILNLRALLARDIPIARSLKFLSEVFSRK